MKQFIILKKIVESFYTTSFMYNSENEAKACCALLNDGNTDKYVSYTIAEIKGE